MDHDEETIRQLYDRFNARDMEAVFSLLTDDVAWANGMDGTHVHGKEAIREYWTHQWSVIDPHVGIRSAKPSLPGVVAWHSDRA
jgi:ketosteroid isomerase-like protein